MILDQNRSCKFIVNYIFYISPILDSLTGFLVLNKFMSEGSLFSPSQMGKIVILGILLFKLYGENKTYFSYLIIFMLSITTLEIIQFIYFGTTIYAYLVGLVQIFKVIYILTIYLYLTNALDRKYIDRDILTSGIIYSGLMYAVILLSTTVIGINTPTYVEGSFGTKGVFASGNGLSVYLGAISSIALYYMFKEYSLKRLIIFLTIFISCILVGTKASIVFLLTNTFFIFYYSKKRVKVILILLGILFVVKFHELFFIVFEVIIRRYENSDSLKAFLSSSRDLYIKNAISQYSLTGIKSLRIFFGSGAFVSFRSSLYQMDVFDTLERDLYDIFFMYGIIGLLFYIFIYIKVVLNLLRKKMYYFMILFTMIFGYSATAGHVVFNSMSGLTLIYCPLLGHVFSNIKGEE